MHELIPPISPDKGNLATQTLDAERRGRKSTPRNKLTLRVRVTNDCCEPFERMLNGREAWMLLELIAAAGAGLTAFAYPGVRIAHHVLLLRRDGIHVETLNESHSGPFAGRHARYVLRSAIEVLAHSDDDDRSAA